MDRASIQADPEISRLIREHFILVAGDRWYQSRRQDAEGRFVQRLDAQAQQIRSGKRVQQGLYCFRADGHLLYHRNNRHVALDALQTALLNWEQLPAETRAPGAIRIEERGRPDPKFHREVPAGATVVNVFMRVLDKDGTGFCVGDSSIEGGTYAARDRMWITKAEGDALIDVVGSQGTVVEFPASLRKRILCYHLCDHTRGQAYAWVPGHIRTSELRMTIVESTSDRVRLRFEGAALLASGSGEEIAKAPKGYDVAFLGYIACDRSERKLTRFDFVAVGDHWGEGRYNRGARAGRSLLGVAYSLCGPDDPGRLVPPQGATGLWDYLRK